MPKLSLLLEAISQLSTSLANNYISSDTMVIGEVFSVLPTVRIQFSTDSKLFRCWVRQSHKIVLRNAFGISFRIDVLTGLVCWDGCQEISVLHHSSVDNDSGDFWDFYKFGLIFLNCEYMRSLLSSSNQRTFMISFVESVTLKLCLLSNKAESNSVLGINMSRSCWNLNCFIS